MSRSLQVVTTIQETRASRIEALRAQAKRLAKEQVDELSQVLDQAAAMAHEITGGGDAYPAGVRELAGRMAEELATRRQTLEVIMARV